MTETRTSENTAEFSVPFGDLKKAIRLAGFGVTTGQPPAIRGVVLDTEDGNLTLRTHNFEIVVSVPVPTAAVTRRGRTVLHYAELKACLDGAAAGEKPAAAARIPVTLSGEVLRTPDMDIPVLAYPIEEYPAPREAAGTLATVDGPTLLRQLDRVLPAAGDDETLPALTCVQLKLRRDGKLCLAATDRYRLACVEIPAQQVAETLPKYPQGLFPAKTLGSLLKLMGGYDGPAEFGADGSRVTLRLGGLEVTAYREGGLPLYESLIPKTFPVGLTYDREQLTRAAKKAEAILRAKHLKGGQSILSFAPDAGISLAPFLEPDQRSKVRAVEIPGKLAHGTPELLDGVQAAVNGKFLNEALAAFDGSTVTLQLPEADKDGRVTKPVLITEEGDTQNFRHLLMVVRITE
ncbi:DNA polymerase III subunit beta [Streptomyces justiciae]|uniref:DNA polymerase III subunit beta n=1 Tax=Streptomyces justiciae TaxID=2780140 RepID=UPI0021183A0B|nr:DNA polymerase III subunit beta [Streptomyces justiciae]MCW8383906.1 DNA polymerase III subunit beta [Streptomyces justiciae]